MVQWKWNQLIHEGTFTPHYRNMYIKLTLFEQSNSEIFLFVLPASILIILHYLTQYNCSTTVLFYCSTELLYYCINSLYYFITV